MIFIFGDIIELVKYNISKLGILNCTWTGKMVLIPLHIPSILFAHLANGI